MFCAYEMKKCFDENESKSYYGMVARDEENRVVLEIKEVFETEEKVEHLVTMANEYDIALEHIEDVINDMIFDS